jgi:hypothetical protein
MNSVVVTAVSLSGRQAQTSVKPGSAGLHHVRRA